MNEIFTHEDLIRKVYGETGVTENQAIAEACNTSYEIQEEIGCQAQIEQFVGRYETATANEPDHQLVSYVYVVTLDHAPQIDAEIAEMKWVDLDDQSTLLAPLTTEIVMPWVKNYLQAEV